MGEISKPAIGNPIGDGEATTFVGSGSTQTRETKQNLVVGVTGDTGHDVCTFYLKGSLPGETSDHKVPRESAADIKVPSGAEYGHLVIKTLIEFEALTECDPKFLPMVDDTGQHIDTFQPELIEFADYKWDHSKNATSCRIRRRRPICEQPDYPHSFGRAPDKLYVDAAQSRGELDCLLIFDNNGKWRASDSSEMLTNSQHLTPAQLVARVLGDSVSAHPAVIVNITGHIPSVSVDPTDNKPRFTSPVWQELFNQPEDVCVIVSATELRTAGAAVSRRLSWEKTVEDFIIELRHFDPLRALGQFGHLIVRFGQVGAIYVRTMERVQNLTLVFAPLAKDGIYREPSEDGMILGKNTLIAAAMIREIIDSRRGGSFDECRMIESIRTGLLAGMRAFDAGYAKSTLLEVATRKIVSDELGKSFIQKTLTLARGQARAIANEEGSIRGDCPIVAIKNGYKASVEHVAKRHRLGSIKLTSEVTERPSPLESISTTRWQIARQQIDRPSLLGSNQPPASLSRINLGIAIVMYGHEYVLNWETSPDSQFPKTILGELTRILTRPEYVAYSEEPRDYTTLNPGQLPHVRRDVQSWRDTYAPGPIYVPLLRLGKLMSIERDEIEGLYSIRNLLKGYSDFIKDSANQKPISIAVFGSPGSGKSFAVRQIAESLNDSVQEVSHHFKPVEYNVSQFRRVDDLAEAITRVASINNENRIPLVFLDEFDCSFEGQPLGWLKYFLAPMQDGTFYGTRQTISIGRAVFVFAGGVSASFSEFDPTITRPPRVGDSALPEETKRKLDHFRSQKGPDFVSRLRGHINIMAVNTEANDVKTIIRRAITLRSIIESRKLITQINEHPPVQVAEIDEDVVFALLTVDLFRHGTRSIEAILQMCSPLSGRIEKASLPAPSQLNMHVDADAFIRRMYRGRFRPNAIEASENKTTSEGSATRKANASDLLKHNVRRLEETMAALIKSVEAMEAKMEDNFRKVIEDSAKPSVPVQAIESGAPPQVQDAVTGDFQS